MHEVTLILPNYALPRRLVMSSIQSSLQQHFSDLAIDRLEVTNQWKVIIEGEDEDVVANTILQEFPSLKPLNYFKVGKEVTGFLVQPGSVGFGLFTDLGLRVLPAQIISDKKENLVQKEKLLQQRTKVDTKAIKSTDFLVTLIALRRQLGDANKEIHAVRQFIKVYGFNEFIPYHFEVRRVKTDLGEYRAWFSRKQIELFRSWKKRGEEILLVGGTTRKMIRQALLKTNHLQDTTEIMRLGFFEWALFFKEGTRAAGIIPRIGKYLGKARLQKLVPSEMPVKLSKAAVSA